MYPCLVIHSGVTSKDLKTLKVPCNAIACWLLLKYIRVNIITNSYIITNSTVPYKYASYILKHFFLIFLDIAKPPASKKILLIIFSLDDITSQLQKTKLYVP